MSKQLVLGEYCYVGDPKDKEKRIWLGYFNGKHSCVHNITEDDFKNGDPYRVSTWETCTPIEDEPEYYYIWEKVNITNGDGYISRSNYITDACAERNNYAKDGWVRNDLTKRLPLGVSE